MLSQSRVLSRFGFWLPARDHQSAEHARTLVTKELIAFSKGAKINCHSMVTNQLGLPACTKDFCMRHDGYEVYTLQEHSLALF